MKAETSKRLFRAIAQRSWDEVDALTRVVVNEERRLGHTRHANQLAQILRDAQSPLSQSLAPLPGRVGVRELVERKDPLALRHHMVLRSDVEARLSRIEREFAARDRLLSYGLKNRSRILLYGSPGCGKSLAAERLAARLGVPLLKVQFDSLMSSLFGESATNLRTVFSTAKAQACVLLMDECDFVAKSRLSSNDVGEVPRIVNTFLQMMEEFSGPGLIVATTNIKQSLDHAVFRRFDDSIEIPPPELEQIQQLLRTTLETVGASAAIDWELVQQRLVGLSAAEIVRLAEDAAKDCILRGQRTVDQATLDKAIADMPRD